MDKPALIKEYSMLFPETEIDRILREKEETILSQEKTIKELYIIINDLKAQLAQARAQYFQAKQSGKFDKCEG